MTLFENLSFLNLYDFGAILLLFTLWCGLGWRIEHPSSTNPSTSFIMANYRREWMNQMIDRQVRIFDAQTVGTLRQGTSFFASTCVIAIGGTLALIGNAEQVAGVAADLTVAQAPAIVWELKLLVIVLFLTNAFLKFVWSNRLFGYCSVMMGASPNDPAHEKAASYAKKAAELNITAARSFNRGLRAIYFALATVAWLAGPIPLIAATIVTSVVIWRREFASQSRKALLEDNL
ncbi:DUF599 domain-containing protein [Sulfitobacter donghicola]|uniref:Membrane protein n=1 Tax=Sulfitobacter donghicola DSW-25 = KCTC 12864 = JCM 14565 TaxID=1300350 RepID=A0A073IM22_9RHOB|nr:DUF599 domain-containing protein [Sulfitobacter donghicola]KEJ90804.1 membrane protein [Sulfitobacter donghicola DSW-25 = KCTC 12864 = JCM 14565]KIN68078.1 hypothetical protein Z948_1805 [Sulfitobacter donghicola DSW-25 = KCTC 12864 = JCM 14565]